MLPTEEIQRHFNKKEVTVLCGAGISVPSGIPQVGSFNKFSGTITNGIVPQILKLLDFNTEQIKSYLKEGIPFESFIQILLESGISLKSLAPIFKGKPCFYHERIIKLLSENRIRSILTTNFDKCFETEINLADIKDILVVNRFTRNLVASHSFRKRAIVKIHGCVSNVNDLAITIKEITNRKSIRRIQYLNTFFLKSTNRKVVLIIGYSCSDSFDISPHVQYLIQTQPENLCKVFYWEYQKKRHPHYVKQKSVAKNAQLMLKGHPNASFVKGDLSYLFNPKEKEIKVYKNNDWQIDLKNYFDSSENFSIIDKKVIKAKLLYSINLYSSSEKIIQKIIKDKQSTKKNLAIILSNYGLILKKTGNLNKALAVYNDAEDNYSAIKDNKGLANCKNNKALVLKRLGRSYEALQLLQESERLSRMVKDYEGVARSLGNQALILKYEGKLKAALSLHKKELKTSLRIGNKESEARCYGNSALVLRRMKKYSEGLELLKKEEDIYKRLGIQRELSYNYETRAMILSDIGKAEEALLMYKKSEEILAKLKDRWGLMTTYINQGELLIKQLDNLPVGLSLIRKAIRMARKSNDGRLNEFRSILQNYL